MITRLDIEERVREWGLREDVVEKDYVIGWVLWGIGADEMLSSAWAFKGGTSLKKCYLETYRFSEDLDFTVLPGGPIRAEELSPILQRVHQQSGIVFTDRPPLLKTHTSGNYTQGRVYYRGPRNTPGVASLILDLNHLCVDLGYAGSVRRLEPYAFRRSKAGKVLLCAVKVQTRESRTYRLDRIQSIKVTNQPFRPTFRVETTGSGHLSVPQLARATTARPFRAVSAFRGPRVVYIIKCTSCGKEFKRSKADYTLRPHKGRGGWQCPSLTGYLVRTSYG